MEERVRVILQRSFDLLKELLVSNSSLSDQPNGRLRYLCGLPERDTILRFALAQKEAAESAECVVGEYDISEFWEPRRAREADFWTLWRYLDLPTRHATSHVIGLQVQRRKLAVQVDSVIDHLRGTPYLDRVHASETVEIAQDVVRLFHSKPPSRLELLRQLQESLEEAGFQCAGRSYNWRFSHPRREWVGFFEIGHKGEPEQVNFYFRVPDPCGWLDVLPIHLNVGLRHGVPLHFHWDQVDNLDRLAGPLMNLVEGIDKLIDG